MASEGRYRFDAAGDRQERSLRAWALLAAVALLAVLATPPMLGRIYVRDDLGAYHLPLRAFYAAQLAESEPFDWMPHLYCGFYVTGEGQGGGYHPWHLLLYRYVPFSTALALEYLVHYPMMMAGAYFFLRRRIKRRDAAMFGALLAAFSGFTLLHFIHPNALAVIAHLPWLLYAIDVAILDTRCRNVAWAVVAIALLTGSQLLLGYPQYVWFSLLTEVSYAALLYFVHRFDWREGCGGTATCHDCIGCTRSPWGRLTVAKLTGLWIGCVQLVSTAAALAESDRRAGDAAFAMSGSLHPWNLAQLIGPYFFTDRVTWGSNTHELGLYCGAVPLVLGVWLVLRRGEYGRAKTLAIASAVFALSALVMALGRFGGFYAIQTALPLVGRFRFPARYIVLVHFALAVAAAIAFVQLAADSRRARRGEFRSNNAQQTTLADVERREAALRGLWFVVALSITLAFAGLVLQDNPHIASPAAVLAGPLLITAAAVLLMRAASGSHAALVALILLAAVDLGVYGFTYVLPDGTARLDQYIATTDVPEPASGGRLLANGWRFDEPGTRVGNQSVLAGWRRADGYAGLDPARRLELRTTAALRTAGVTWVRSSDATLQIPGLDRSGGEWLEVPDPLPKVRLVTATMQSEQAGADIDSIDVATTALTERPLMLAGGEPGTAELVRGRPGEMLIACQCETPQLLVVAESYHDGWRAQVDGKPIPLIRVNGDFLGCPIRAGRHQVVLQFKPRSLGRGKRLSALGFLLLGGCFVGYRFGGLRKFWERLR